MIQYRILSRTVGRDYMSYEEPYAEPEDIKLPDEDIEYIQLWYKADQVDKEIEHLQHELDKAKELLGTMFRNDFNRAVTRVPDKLLRRLMMFVGTQHSLYAELEPIMNKREEMKNDSVQNTD